MLAKLKNYLFIGALSLLLLAPVPVNAQFDFFRDTCTQTPGSTVCRERTRNRDPVIDTIRKAANILATVTAVAAVFMIILGAYNLVTSGGNAETVAKGRRRIIYSLIGVVVVALAWTLTRFITDRVIQ